MHMVIFGAGASYDSNPSRRPHSLMADDGRPPLANNLFDHMAQHLDALRPYPEIRPILNHLRPNPDRSVEQMLEALQVEAENDPGRLPQIGAVRFYLQQLFWGFDVSWKPEATNYEMLLDQLRRRRLGNLPTLLVTFNYDLLIEEALKPYISIKHIKDYVGSNIFQLIKPHGSINWAREVAAPDIEPNQGEHALAHEIIRRSGELEVGDIWHLVREYPSTKVGGSVTIPAIAIPVQAKAKFECPSGHLQVLVEHLSKVSKILVVGWKGAEAHFVKLLREHVAQEIEVLVVAESVDGTEPAVEQMSKITPRAKVRRDISGFSDFTLRHTAEEFFGRA